MIAARRAKSSKNPAAKALRRPLHAIVSEPVADEPRDDVEIAEHARHLEARFLGTFTVKSFNEQVDAAVRACRERKRSLLLIDVTRLEAHPTTVDRFEIASHGARVASDFKVVVVAPRELIDPFGALVARNRGLDLNVLSDPEKALAWLLAPKDA